MLVSAALLRSLLVAGALISLRQDQGLSVSTKTLTSTKSGKVDKSTTNTASGFPPPSSSKIASSRPGVTVRLWGNPGLLVPSNFMMLKETKPRKRLLPTETKTLPKSIIPACRAGGRLTGVLRPPRAFST
jgi:hypothetical protein